MVKQEFEQSIALLLLVPDDGAGELSVDEQCLDGLCGLLDNRLGRLRPEEYVAFQSISPSRGHL